MKMSRRNEVWDVPKHTDYLLAAWDKPGFNRGRHRAVLEAVANNVTTDSVLDAGCGMGHFYPVLKEKYPDIKYLGFDVSVEMLKKANEFFLDEEIKDRERGGSGEFFVEGDIYNMKQFGKFSTVVCIDILIHLPEIEVPIKELWEHTEYELIIATHVSGEDTLREYGSSSKLELPPDKKLIYRTDILEKYMDIFNNLKGEKTIESKIYDRRTTVFILRRKDK
jgi:trans-aconitate methyltransferase